jgi:hypothetical protein
VDVFGLASLVIVVYLVVGGHRGLSEAFRP